MSIHPSQLPAPAKAGAVYPVTLTLAEARSLPVGRSPRLACRWYDAPAKTLPNGLPRTTPLVADALLLIGGSFLVTARILRDVPNQPPSRFQIDRTGRDTATGQIVTQPAYGPGLIRAAYDEMCRRQVLVNARRNAQKRRN